MRLADIDNINKERRGVGRPEVNPFPSAEVEEDFAVRCRKLIELYYIPDTNSKTNFHFPQDRNMSKTLFWSLIYIYYVDQKGLTENLQGFLSVVSKHIDRDYYSDRGAISRTIKMLRNMGVTIKPAKRDRSLTSEERAKQKYRVQYQYVVGLFCSTN